MKSFTEFYFDLKKKYEFKIKIAGCDFDSSASEMHDRLEHALKAFDVENISKAKRLPPDVAAKDFPNIKDVEVYLITVVLNYPVTDDQLHSVISHQARIPGACVKVVNKNAPDEEEASAEDADAQSLVGDKRVSNFMKELQTMKFESAGKDTEHQPEQDDKENKKSPMGS